MANIRKRPNGTYQAQIYTGRDSSGKQMYEYITMDGWNECRLAANDREIEISSGSLANIGKAKVTDGIKQWIELKRSELSPSTIRVYYVYLNAHYKPFFGDLRYKQIMGNELLLRKFKSELLKKLPPNTAYKILSVLGKIFRETLRDKNPLRYVELPKKEKAARRVPDDVEFAQIHLAVADTIDEVFALLAAWCGMRLGEICAIKPDDIYDDKIRINESLALNDSYDWEFKRPKSDNGIREVAVPEYLMGLIKKHRIKKGKFTDRIFNYLPGSYTKRWTRIIKEKELPDVTFHSLRHYHASWLFNEGFDDQYAARRLGQDTQTLKSIYQHLWGKRIISQDEIVKEKLKNAGQKENEGSQ